MSSLRVIFPALMFVLATASFGFGTWQYFVADAVRQADAGRLAFILETIEHSDASRADKQGLYVSIATGLPRVPPTLGIDVSGSFAAPDDRDDRCGNDGQRTLCRALYDHQGSAEAISAVCGICDPR